MSANTDAAESEPSRPSGPATEDVEMSATATKQKLEKLMTDFATFDDVMRIGTRVRDAYIAFPLVSIDEPS